jgi:hypothetical protein
LALPDLTLQVRRALPLQDLFAGKILALGLVDNRSQCVEAELGAGVPVSERQGTKDHERDRRNPHVSSGIDVPARLHGQPCPTRQ